MSRRFVHQFPLLVVSATVFFAGGCSDAQRPVDSSRADSATKKTAAERIDVSSPATFQLPALATSEAGDLQACDAEHRGMGSTADDDRVLRFAGVDSQLRGQMQLGWKPAVNERPWKYIVLHHTAVERGSVESIHRQHSARKDRNGNPWLGIGYHFVIGNGQGMRDGLAEPTFRWTKQMHGAHAGNRKYNELGIGVCLVGNFEKHAPTSAQVRTTQRLLTYLRETYKIPAKNIIGHGDIKNTACPGRLFSLAKVTHGATTSLLSDTGSQESLAKRDTVAQPSRNAETQE